MYNNQREGTVPVGAIDRNNINETNKNNYIYSAPSSETCSLEYLASVAENVDKLYLQ
jgi:hypothetical protein